MALTTGYGRNTKFTLKEGVTSKKIFDGVVTFESYGDVSGMLGIVAEEDVVYRFVIHSTLALPANAKVGDKVWIDVRSKVVRVERNDTLHFEFPNDGTLIVGRYPVTPFVETRLEDDTPPRVTFLKGLGGLLLLVMFHHWVHKN